MQLEEPSLGHAPNVTFKFKQLIPGVIIFALILLTLAVAAGVGIAQVGVNAALGIPVAIIILMSIVGGIAVIGSSNLTVNKDGVSRSFCGYVLQQIHWGDALLIKVFSAPRREGRVGKVLIHIISNSRHRGFLAHKIWFQEDPRLITELIAALNYYIALFDVEVREETPDGRSSSVRSISNL